MRVLRDATTSVEEDTSHSIAISFPSRVYDIEGRYVRDVQALYEVQNLQSGAYMLASRSGFIVLHVAQDHGVFISK
jgi:hypothetical protein